MRNCKWFVLVISVLLLVHCSWTMESIASKTIQASVKNDLSRKQKTGRREGRFLGLLGLLTGLTLVDSLDDDNDRPRRSGFVKIDVGHPSALDAFYGAYGYASPYWTGGSSINIKIPFRPPGSEFETMALFPFPMHFPQHGPSHFATGPTAIEPRPTIFSDPIPSASNGSGTTLADDVEQLSARKQKLAHRKAATVSRRPRPKVGPPRTIRSTLRADGEADDDEISATTVEVPEATDMIETQEPQEALEPSVSNDPTVSPTNTPTNNQAPVSEDPEPANPASIVQSELNYVTQPMIPSSYHTHQHSLADVSAIELTTSAGYLPYDGTQFQPSRADHWQNYYTSVAQNGAKRQPGFLPIATRVN
ncbi:uncharacterized protein LOC126556187 [Anopheles maculipalpis]|uniref:uncharacterized protein LOC126556187 n=1 Tax=Anopheles maculipalpis TaxID=1496333 RepID=UPI00215926D2|nr:uncharacterized protein LOC126556187 [Anopheles maculipalpis]